MLINGKALGCTDSFTYLGSAVTNTNSSDLKIERHVQSTSKAFGALQKCLWPHHDVKLVHKNQGIQHCHTPSLVILNRDNNSVLTSPKATLQGPSFNICEATIHIKWQERVPDVQVLKRAGTVSAEATITARQLR